MVCELALLCNVWEFRVSSLRRVSGDSSVSSGASIPSGSCFPCVSVAQDSCVSGALGVVSGASSVASDALGVEAPDTTESGGACVLSVS